MLENFYDSLTNLEKSFLNTSKDITQNTSKVLLEIEKLKDIQNTGELKINSLSKVTSLLEKLSIQNEFKLSILREFPSYISNKK